MTVPTDEPLLDGAWRHCLRNVLAIHKKLPQPSEMTVEQWEVITADVCARMSAGGFVPMTGWREALATMAGRLLASAD